MIDVTLEPLRDDVDALQPEWRDLEERSDASFFTSWTWIGSWLASLDGLPPLQLLRAREAGRTVALAVFGQRRTRRRGFVASRALFLNETGDAAFDRLTIEYNAILADRERAGGALAAVAAYLHRHTRVWNELHLHGTPQAPALFDALPGLARRAWTKQAPRVCLERVRERGGDYLGLLKQKPRYHVRRSAREYEALGALSLEVAADLDAARAALAELIALHTCYWQRRGEGGAFATPFVRAFHDRLLAAGCARGEIQLATLRAGGRTVGCLYNFVHRGHVYNYQTGFDYDLTDGGQDSPGLVTHARAIELNARLGHAVYDFMAGDYLYKRGLATDCDALHWSVVQRATPALRLENGLRELRRLLFRR